MTQVLREKIVGFLGTEGGVCFSELGFYQALDAIGENTGNTMFQYALWSSIRNLKISINFNGDLQALKERIDLIFLPAANQINPHWDLSPWADALEQLDKPVAIAGLGAQSQLNKTTDLDLKPGTLRFLKIVSERAKLIGVRGAFTQEVLEKLGITNTIITGCPSQFINPAVSGRVIQKNIDKVKTRDAMKLAYLFGTLEAHTRDAERILFDLGSTHKAVIIYQTNLRILQYIYDGALPAETRTYFEWEGSLLAPHMPLDEYMRVIRWRGAFYSDARTWIDDMRRYDLVLGMRIHGAVAAIQSGGLGVCVAFDSRTLELAQTMGYPYILASELQAKDTLRDVTARIVFDAENFERKRNVLRQNLMQIFRLAELDDSAYAQADDPQRAAS